MRFSEAMRLGAMWKPQCFGCVTDGLGTCAIGAALESMGVGVDDFDAVAYQDCCRIWNAHLPRFSECPACDYGRAITYRVITHLNDHHRWTREAIADFVATIEARHDEIHRPAEAALVE